MKKAFAILLTLALIATLSVLSFAVELPEASNQDLTVHYTDLVLAETVYSVDVVWEEDLVFNYNAGAEGVWDPANHNYKDSAVAEWKDNTVNVAVTNHSNADVLATVEVTDTDAEDGVTVAPDKTTATLATAVGRAVADADTVTFTLTATGTPVETVSTVASVTISFADANAPVPVSPSNLQDRTYTLVKPTTTDACTEAILISTITFNPEDFEDSEINVVIEFVTYVCEEHCLCEYFSNDDGHRSLSHNGKTYCYAGLAGSEDIFEITNDQISISDYKFELLSNDSLRVVSVPSTDEFGISVGDIFS